MIQKVARLLPDVSIALSYGKCDVPTMKTSIGSEKIVFWREARAAFRAAGGTVGSASPPACTLRALAMTFFWFGQITSHTFRNIVTARRMPA